jgi:type I restriction enzyme M protein
MVNESQIEYGFIGKLQDLKYSYRSRSVSMDETEKNDFNPNISRYVSTSVDEEIIDLQAVNTKLVDIEERITKAREMHNGFLRELALKEI